MCIVMVRRVPGPTRVQSVLGYVGCERSTHMVIRAPGSVGIAGLVDGWGRVAGGRWPMGRWITVIRRIVCRIVVVGRIVGDVGRGIVGRVVWRVCVWWWREFGRVVGWIVGIHGRLRGWWGKVVRLGEVTGILRTAV